MKKHSFFTALITAAVILSITACASTSGSSSGSSSGNAKLDEAKKLIIGTWFFDSGYNPDARCDDQITFNSDGTFDTHHFQPGYREWDKGNYAFVSDDNGILTFKLNITKYADHLDGSNNPVWNDINITSYFNFNVDKNILFLNRYKRDKSAMGWGIDYSDPAIYNPFYRTEKGTKEILFGKKWRIDKVRTPDCDWDEEWTFTDDGKMQAKWLSGASYGTYDGNYDIKEKDGKSILHQTLDLGNGTPDEWWYEFISCGPDIINVNLFKMKRGGQEIIPEQPVANFYYNDVPLVKYTYQIKTAATIYNFTDYWPEGKRYELFNLSKQLHYKDVPFWFWNQEILGIYESQDFSGEPVTYISENNNTKDRTFFIDWAVRCKKNIWNESKGIDGYNHGFDIPANEVKNKLHIPAKGEKVKVFISAKTSKDFSAWGGPTLKDFSNNWIDLGSTWKFFETNNKKIAEIFEFEITEEMKSAKISDLGFGFGYAPNDFDEEVVFTDVTIEMLDDSDIVEQTLSFGGTKVKKLAVKNSEFVLPRSTDFLPWEQVHWSLKSRSTVEGWYDNPDFKGDPIDTYFVSENAKPKTFYGKRAFKFGTVEAQDDGRYYTNCHFLINSICPDVKINPKNGDIVPVYVSGKCSVDYTGDIGLDIMNCNVNDGWLGNDWHSIEIKDGKFETIFNLHLIKDANFSSIDDIALMLAYHPSSLNEQMIIKDLKVAFLDKSNSYNITYNYGSCSSTVKVPAFADTTLFATQEQIKSLDWRFSEQKLIGWYNNPELKGTPVTVIPAGNKTDKTVWMKYDLNSSRRDWDENGKANHLWDVQLPFETFISGFDSSWLKKDTTVKIKVTADVSESACNRLFMRLIDVSNYGWRQFGWTDEDVEIVNGKLSHTFNLQITEDAKPALIENIDLSIGYNKETLDKPMTLSNWKVELVK